MLSFSGLPGLPVGCDSRQKSFQNIDFHRETSFCLAFGQTDYPSVVIRGEKSFKILIFTAKPFFVRPSAKPTTRRFKAAKVRQNTRTS